MLNLLRAAGSSLASTPDLMPLVRTLLGATVVCVPRGGEAQCCRLLASPHRQATLRHAICADAACEATAADGLRAFLGILQ